jgi:hypothetical protein
MLCPLVNLRFGILHHYGHGFSVINVTALHQEVEFLINCLQIKLSFCLCRILFYQTVNTLILFL